MSIVVASVYEPTGGIGTAAPTGLFYSAASLKPILEDDMRHEGWLTGIAPKTNTRWSDDGRNKVLTGKKGWGKQ